MGGKIQCKDNISNENQNCCDQELSTLENNVAGFSQIGEQPLPPIRIFHGALPDKDISRNNHDYWEMVQKCISLV